MHASYYTAQLKTIRRGCQDCAPHPSWLDLDARPADNYLSAMIVELVNTGSELTCGRALNTHQQWLCRQLSDAGYVVRRQVAVSDEPADIAAAVRESLGRADLVVTTGGLGPTSDDRTRDVIAELLGLKLCEDAEVLAQVRSFFEKRNRPMPERVRVEALVPEGAVVLPNRHGTAPGLAVPVPPGRFRTGSTTAWLLMLPGPPRELQPMFLESALPLLRRELRPVENLVCRTVRTWGLGESLVHEKVEPALSEFVRSGLEIGYCARPGQVDVRLTVAGPGSDRIIARAEQALRTVLGSSVFGVEDQTLESVLIDLLAARGRTLAVAESCTGGCLAHRLTNVPGASRVFPGGFVTYSNEMKQRCLGVHAASLETHGAVSEPVAQEMAKGARLASGSHYAIAITGIAGPDGGTTEKPVGTVFIAFASPEKTIASRKFHPWDRQTFKEVTASDAMNELRRLVMENF